MIIAEKQFVYLYPLYLAIDRPVTRCEECAVVALCISHGYWNISRNWYNPCGQYTPHIYYRLRINQSMNLLDETVQSALDTFVDEALDGSWDGRREREAVSLFAFGALVEQVNTEGILRDSRQIGLEVPVPQVTVGDENSANNKNQVCKDVVIWSEPGMTCWDESHDPTVPPVAIIEWKFDRASIYDADVSWLEAFTAEYPNCIGYAVTANQQSSRFTLSCTRVTNRQTQAKWLHVP